MNNTPTVIEIQVNASEQKAVDMFHEVKETRSAIWIKQKQIRDILEEDQEYLKNKTQLNKINKNQKVKKEKLMDNPKIRMLVSEIKELKKTLKAEQLTLFGHLEDYTKTGKTHIKIDGKTKTIEKEFKVKEV